MKKWSPTTLDADSKVAVEAFDPCGIAEAAIFVKEIELVLLASIHVGEQWVVRAAKMFCLSARDSDTAYINEIDG